ncbi:manganese transport protein MntH [Klebsiella pneumoniae]|uniref:Manganese transport protein MntH n=1 Tax=Klebsiella pneumoniae TaxID=573 RepID=A0A2X1QPU5_KLEPN|nr:manganese transport protein MntH [Klebsiella pneumoniae]
MTSSRVENSSSRAARKVKLALMGPAFVAAIGYIDPGNFATNIQAGASFGYQLLWVVVWANLMAMLIQVLSAKLGIATGKNLAEQIRDHYPPPGNESGVAQLWHCACPGAAADIYQQCEADGDLVNTRWVRGIGWAIVAIVVSLNGWLIVGSLLGVD